MSRFIQYSLWVVVAVVSLGTRTAMAWEQTPGKEGGIAWTSSCFHYAVQKDGSDDLGLDDLREIVRSSFDTWEDVPCSYFYFVEREPAAVDRVEFNLNSGNINLLVWRDKVEDWTYIVDAVGMTTTHYDELTDELLDVDIEFNGAWWDFGTLDEGSTDSEVIDLANAITHEIGHTIGLKDLYDPRYSDSTMYGNSGPADIEKRSLLQDDIDGLCTIYPVDDDPKICKEPYCGLDLKGTSTFCIIDDDNSENGCAFIEKSRQTGWSGALLSLFLLTIDAL